jgi:DNA-binding NarL/FixJ family response regulator
MSDRKGLTIVEFDVIGFMAEGLTNQEIADQTKLTVGSVETYRNRIYKKLNAKNGAHCMAICFKKGILTV